MINAWLSWEWSGEELTLQRPGTISCMPWFPDPMAPAKHGVTGNHSLSTSSVLYTSRDFYLSASLTVKVYY